MVQPEVADEPVEGTVLVPVAFWDAGVALRLDEGPDPRVVVTPPFGLLFLAELSSVADVELGEGHADPRLDHPFGQIPPLGDLRRTEALDQLLHELELGALMVVYFHTLTVSQPCGEYGGLFVRESAVRGPINGRVSTTPFGLTGIAS